MAASATAREARLALDAAAQPGSANGRAEPLVHDLAVLANPQRVHLLRLLREPRTASEIRLAPSQSRRGGGPGRPMSTQAVRKHLEQLAEHGFVQRLPTARRGVPADAYVVNHARLYQLAEEMRRLASLRPLGGADGATLQLAEAGACPGQGAPRLVVAHGLQEGQGFTLVGPRVSVGRRKGSDVRLDYDPFVSSDHAELAREGDAWTLRDLRSRNGTHVNWQPLPKGGARALRHGDLVGVGRTLLLLWL